MTPQEFFWVYDARVGPDKSGRLSQEDVQRYKAMLDDDERRRNG